MFKIVIAGLMAASLTLTSANPVQAQGLTEDQIGKLLFGLVATAAIASIIDKKTNRPEPEPQVAPHQSWPRGTTRPRQTERFPRRHQQPQTSPWQHQPRETAQRHVLPAECFASYQTRFGTVRMFARRCMRDNYRHVRSLPRSCAVRAITDEGPRAGWDPKCLRDNGYRISRLR